jgi:hypothetical protein
MMMPMWLDLHDFAVGHAIRNHIHDIIVDQNNKQSITDNELDEVLERMTTRELLDMLQATPVKKKNMEAAVYGTWARLFGKKT